MTALQVARIKLDVVRYRARRATLRLMRRVLDWMEPERQADERQGKQGRPVCRS